MCKTKGRNNSWRRVGGRRGTGAGCGAVASMRRTRTPPDGVSPMDGPGGSQDTELGDLLALVNCTEMAPRPRLDHLCRSGHEKLALVP